MKLKDILKRFKPNRDFEEEYLDDEIDFELEEMEDEMSSRDKLSFKKLNKKIVAAMIIAALTISAIVGVSTVKAFGNKEEEATQTTIEATTQNIQKTFSATGSIISASESGEFATTMNSYPVEEVYVKVGDVVKAGDPLYKLDMSTVEEQLSYQQQALNIQNQQNALAAESAEKNLQDAVATGTTQINDANRNLDQAKQDQNTAQRNLNNATTALNNARTAENQAEREYDRSNNAVAAAQSKVNQLSAKVAEDDSENLKNELKSAQEELSNATATREAKKAAYEAAVSARQQAERDLQSANDGVASANRQVDAANANVNNQATQVNSNVVSQTQAVANGKLSAQASTLNQQQEISKTKDELSKATVYASQDGTVTNVNIVKGKTYSGTDAVVIDNVTSLKATTDIDEAQIANIAVGQRVEIKTDSTGDEVLYGTVTFVSPTATKNSTKSTETTSTTAAVSKSRATYRVDVSLDATNDRLRLGMTAKMNFILASADNVLAVPTSDIQTNTDGTKYVVVEKKDGTTENVTVTTGIFDDFYTEITGGNLKNGAKIVEQNMDGGYQQVIDSMGTDGGIYFD